MRKEELKKLRRLDATQAMMEKAMMDTPVKTRVSKFYGWEYEKYKYGLYMRCQHLGGYLKISFFLADLMRAGGRKSVYDLYINPESGEFITYDNKRDMWRDAKLDCLEWPQYKYYSGIYINKESRKAIVRTLGVSGPAYEAILKYQQEFRAKKLREQHARETDPWDKLMQQIPELPKDWINWVGKTGIDEHYIIYNYERKGAKEGFCSHCKKMVPIDNPKNYKKGKCKSCGAKVTFKAVGKMGRGFRTDDHTVYLMQKCRDGFVIREFSSRTTFESSKYKEPITTAYEVRRVIVSSNIEMKTFNWGLYKNIKHRWIKSYHEENYGLWGPRNGMVYKKTLPQLAKKELSRTGLPEMLKTTEKFDPELYLRKLRKKPYIEQLIKSGLVKLAIEVTEGESINIQKSDDFAKALGIDKQRMKRLKENNGNIVYLEWLRHEKMKNTLIQDKIIGWFTQGGVGVKDIRFILDRMSETQVYNYLSRQMVTGDDNVRQVLTTWKDYLSMADKLKMDTSMELIYKPKDLYLGHQEMIKLTRGPEIAAQTKKILKDYPNVDKICKEIKSKYEFSDKEYTIIAPEGAKDIVLEGIALNHCVDTAHYYFERINTHESYILFLRKTNNVDKPYYTIEVEPNGTIRQKRTTGDKQNADIEDAKKFLLKWQKEVQKRITDKERKLGEESRKRRCENYKKLRTDKVKIRGGIFAGELLADILEADLMEIETDDRKVGQIA